MKVCVYCASSAKLASVYLDATAEIARLLVEHGCQIAYGGGSLGLMGKLADVVVEMGGDITGIMPHFMKDVEWAHPKVEKFVFTADMRERKAKLLEGVDAVLALPGGTGTLDELFEVITLKRLGQFNKPIVIVSTNGFYEPLKALFQKCQDEQFMSSRNLGCWTFVETPEEIIPAIENAPPWGDDAITFAVNQ
jgi:TIGR00730 family protein